MPAHFDNIQKRAKPPILSSLEHTYTARSKIGKALHKVSETADTLLAFKILEARGFDKTDFALSGAYTSLMKALQHPDLRALSMDEDAARQAASDYVERCEGAIRTSHTEPEPKNFLKIQTKIKPPMILSGECNIEEHPAIIDGIGELMSSTDALIAFKLLEQQNIKGLTLPIENAKKRLTNAMKSPDLGNLQIPPAQAQIAMHAYSDRCDQSLGIAGRARSRSGRA